MKVLFFSIMVSSSLTLLEAKDIIQSENKEMTKATNAMEQMNCNKDMKVTYLTKLLSQQQKNYSEKVIYLENELRKTQERLIEKSMKQEKLEDAMAFKYKTENISLKKELAYKTKSLFEYQRQMEKIHSTNELKNMIKINSGLASDLRRSEDQIAVMQLKRIEETSGSNLGGRFPASVKEGK